MFSISFLAAGQTFLSQIDVKFTPTISLGLQFAMMYFSVKSILPWQQQTKNLKIS